MRYEDAKAHLLSESTRRDARIAIANGEDPLCLLDGYTGDIRETMTSAIVDEMRAGIKRVNDDFAFHRGMNASFREG